MLENIFILEENLGDAFMLPEFFRSKLFQHKCFFYVNHTQEIKLEKEK